MANAATLSVRARDVAAGRVQQDVDLPPRA